MNAFHVFGGLLAIWALVVSFLGITRENWPNKKGVERAVIAISITLVACAICAAVLTAVAERNEEEEKEHEGSEEHGLVLPV